MIKFIELLEKNVPTNPKLWSKFKSQAKSKFDVYPSAYANGWAAKQYKKAGGGWKSVSEELSEETGEQITIISEEGEKKKVKLGKVQRGGSKKFYVHVKNDKGNVVKVSFGDPNMEIKRDDAESHFEHATIATIQARDGKQDTGVVSSGGLVRK